MTNLGSPFGIVSLIAGLLGLFTGWAIGFFVPVAGIAGGLALPILAIVFGIIGITKDDSKGMGIAGLILGIIGAIVTVVVVVVLPLIFAFSFFSLYL